MPPPVQQSWVERRLAALAERPQDMHLTSADGGNAWSYMRELLTAVRDVQPAVGEADATARGEADAEADAGPSWLERVGWDARLATVQAIYADRVSRMPSLPWEDDAYRRCEYAVDWSTGRWTVDNTYHTGAPRDPRDPSRAQKEES